MAPATTPLFIGGMGGPLEIGLLVLLAVLLFGANKIPKLARSTGEAMGEFQKGREQAEQELEEIRGDMTESSGSSSNADANREQDSSTEFSETDF